MFEAGQPVPANQTAMHPDCTMGPTTCCPFVLQEDDDPAGGVVLISSYSQLILRCRSRLLTGHKQTLPLLHVAAGFLMCPPPQHIAGLRLAYVPCSIAPPGGYSDYSVNGRLVDAMELHGSFDGAGLTSTVICKAFVRLPGPRSPFPPAPPRPPRPSPKGEACCSRRPGSASDMQTSSSEQSTCTRECPLPKSYLQPASIWSSYSGIKLRRMFLLPASQCLWWSGQWATHSEYDAYHASLLNPLGFQHVASWV